MLEGNDYCALDIFLFVFAYDDKWTGFSEELPLTMIHLQYTGIGNVLMSDNYSNGWSTKDLANSGKTMWNYKKAFWKILGPH